jgi:hypothetical protein
MSGPMQAQPASASDERQRRWHRLLFLNRTLSAGVPIPPLDVEVGA